MPGRHPERGPAPSTPPPGDGISAILAAGAEWARLVGAATPTSGPLDPQVAQQPLERLPVGVVLLPAGEVADVPLPAQQPRPRLLRLEYSAVYTDREQH